VAALREPPYRKMRSVTSFYRTPLYSRLKSENPEDPAPMHSPVADYVLIKSATEFLS